MAEVNIFEWMVEYHCKNNLKNCIPYIKNGRVYSNGKAVKEGEENDLYQGVLIVANGNTLLRKLIDKKLILPEDMGESFKINGIDDFFKCIDRQKNKDGAFIYDSIDKKMINAYSINNNTGIADTPKFFANMFPKDFVYSDSRGVQRKDIGTKTKLAVELPLIYDNINTYQIKRTGYTNLGIGKVTHFDKDGLKKEFFFRCGSHPIGEGYKIMGVNKEYIKDMALHGKRRLLFTNLSKVELPLDKVNEPKGNVCVSLLQTA